MFSSAQESGFVPTLFDQAVNRLNETAPATGEEAGAGILTRQLGDGRLHQLAYLLPVPNALEGRPAGSRRRALEQILTARRYT